ncbi:D-alanyl-D-alanine carboxypeptidase [Catenuloplanes nepalensis]|uniref:D-alanyl-D-alanine carboxypeptidase n=1 Tax=Catenuloplanes nepalensis TaxID=587533 RepID=A0ABT9MZC4_9ACTN|nr:serine hydrolase domain-containing protein [Catenuloplanes nepalensis]MDP9796710.1 D-alanyl-D-alanine carboxypeptidase [Catenuloplanes nepalensis]
MTIRAKIIAAAIMLLTVLVVAISAAVTTRAPSPVAQVTTAAPAPAPVPREAPAAQDVPETDAAFQRSLNALISTDGFPGVLASVEDPGGDARDYTAGAGDVATGEAPPTNGYVRIGSNTKTFVAVVVLQMVSEGQVGLDRSIQTYLPGVVPGGKNITVRQLLQHTSGLANYTDHMRDEDFDEGRHLYRSPRSLLDIAFSKPPTFPPGKGWRYSNTGYVVLGLMIERLSGRTVGEEITTRVINRLGLRETYFPAGDDETLRAPHPRAYEDDPRDDVTVSDPSWAWAAGAMIATPRDLNAFFRALLFESRLLGPAELAEMRRTVDTGDQMWPGVRYGLGLTRTPLRCGDAYWGHGGDVPGFETRGGVRDDGRTVTVAVTSGPSGRAAHLHVVAAVETAFCG